MNTLLWNLHQWSRRLGRLGLAGLALLIAALFIRQMEIAPRQAALDEGAARIATLEAAAKKRAAAPASKLVAKPLLVEREMPTIKLAAGRVAELEKLADKHKLQLLRGQYTPTPVGGTRLVRWQIVFPIDAPYPAIRAFVADSLAAMPMLALEDIRIKREKIEEGTVAAELRFNLYLQEAAP